MFSNLNFPETYISEKFNCSYELIREERGKIPMTEFEFPACSSDGIIHIGSAAGAIKPSTGYAFNRISRHTEYLMKCFLTNNINIKKKNITNKYDELINTKKENKEKIDNQTPEAVPLPDKTVKQIETKKENKQNPDKLDEEVKLSDVAKNITYNYTLHYECVIKHDAWIEWYQSQKKIFESVK